MNQLNRSLSLALLRRGGRFHVFFLLTALTAALCLAPSGRVRAQIILINSDGAYPSAGLILLSNTLYGTASAGGMDGNGTVFAIHTDGTGFTNLHSLTYSDGINPFGGLDLSGSTLYGTAQNGGTSGSGTMFAFNTDGAGFTNFHSFSSSDAAPPYGGLIVSGSTVYGAAQNGGSWGNGTLFAVNTDGTGFTNLYSFNSQYVSTNSDGAFPSGLVASGNTLYGTALRGGPSGNGTVFKIYTSGSGFSVLYSFEPSSINPSGSYTNSTGANPQGLILSGNALYGVAQAGGSSGSGSVFKVNTDGTGFTNLHSFDAGSDGYYPNAGLVLSGSTLYGTARVGGSSGAGTVFKLNTDGTGFTVLHNFNDSDGMVPNGLVLSTNTLFGTTSGSHGWSSFDNGRIFAISTDGTGFTNLYNFTPLFGTPPHLKVMISGTNVVLAWPTYDPTAPGTYFLVSTTNAGASQSTTASWRFESSPTIVNGQNIVTNPITDTQRFYSLVWGCLVDNDCNGNGIQGFYDCVGGGGLVGECVRRGL